MYFWRIEALKTELVARPLSDRQVLPYLVVISVLIVLVGFIPREEMNNWDILSGSWSVFLAAMGTFYIYRRNGGEQGEHLLHRYVTVGWVVSVRWLAALILIGFISYGILAVVSEVPETTTWHELLVLGAAEALLYWRVGHHIGEVANAAAAKQLA